MAKAALKALILAAVLAAGSGCSDLREGTAVFTGNDLFNRGDYQAASLRYLEVLPEAKYSAFLRYNLGNVYKALGETNSALAVWSQTDPTASEELQFRLAFNRGHLQFQRGMYAEAFASFKQALVIRPKNLDAKRNLEISLIKLQALQGVPVPKTASPGQAVGQPADPEARAMLDYIRRLEGNKWKSNRTPSAAPSAEDW